MGSGGSFGLGLVGLARKEREKNINYKIPRPLYSAAVLVAGAASSIFRVMITSFSGYNIL